MENGAKERLSRRHVLLGAAGATIAPAAAAALPSLPDRALARAVQQPATKDDERFMREAIAEAARGDYPFGTVIVKNGSIMARGRNLGKHEKDPTAHGEMVAIRNFLAAHGPDQLKGTTLYTSGESCPMCMGAVVWCGISRVVFGASIAELATKIGQIMLTDSEIAGKTPFADIGITGGVLAGVAGAVQVKRLAGAAHS